MLSHQSIDYCAENLAIWALMLCHLNPPILHIHGIYVICDLDFKFYKISTIFQNPRNTKKLRNIKMFEVIFKKINHI